VTSGSNVTFTIVATNHGPADAAGVTVTDTLPAGLTFVSVATTKGSCTGTATVTCTIGALTNGQSATITIVACTSTTGSFTNTTTLTATNLDPASHASSSAPFTVVPPPTPPPAVVWQGPDPGDWDPKDPAKVAIEERVATVKQTLELASSVCHSS
jgi:uncharacterized repeat protein (TIGR01451 family)